MAKADVVALDACATPCVDPTKVEAARSRLVSHDEAGRLGELFKLLADPHRMRMLYALVEAGELCVCDLSATVGVPESNVSHALRLLRTAGVVRARRSGRMAYYSLVDAHVQLLLDVSREHLRHEAP
jgi:ArsR family transcriptional regulator, lead/cadmium/zinc/bismuth-responsive transcriptional repressor